MILHRKIHGYPFSRWVYIVMYLGSTLTGLFFLVNGEINDAAPALALGLIFDPCDPEVKVEDRPWTQKALLVIHLVIGFFLMTYRINHC